MRMILRRGGHLRKVAKVGLVLYLLFTVHLLLRTYWFKPGPSSASPTAFVPVKGLEVGVRTTSRSAQTTAAQTTAEHPSSTLAIPRVTQLSVRTTVLSVRNKAELFRKHDAFLRQKIAEIMRSRVISPEEYFTQFMENQRNAPSCTCTNTTSCVSTPTEVSAAVSSKNGLPLHLTQSPEKINDILLAVTFLKAPKHPPHKSVNIEVEYDRTRNVNEKMAHMEFLYKHVKKGGRWWPSIPGSESMAIIIPFRDRWHEVVSLLKVLHPMLLKQNRICYQIFIVEQDGKNAFNKGRLNNAAVRQILKYRNFDCILFHDADVVPLNYNNIYKCPTDKSPIHYVNGLDTTNYKLPYASMLGGALAFTKKQYFYVNGYSNFYWGWGLEDDDMELRLKNGYKFRYSRARPYIGVYKILPHIRQKIYTVQAARRKALLSTATKRSRKDGLNSVKYKVLHMKHKPLYTHLLIDVGQQPPDFTQFNPD